MTETPMNVPAEFPNVPVEFMYTSSSPTLFERIELDDAGEDPDKLAAATQVLRVSGVLLDEEGVAHLRQCKHAPRNNGFHEDIAIEELILAMKCACIPFKYHFMSLKLTPAKVDAQHELRIYKRKLTESVMHELEKAKRQMLSVN